MRARVLVGTMAAIAAIGIGWSITHRPAPAATVYNFSATSDQRWQTHVSAGSVVSVTFLDAQGRGTVADVHVDKLQPLPTGEYFANFDTNTPDRMAGYKTFTFSARSVADAKGKPIHYLKVAIEKGNDRWRSTLLNVTGVWRPYQLPLGQFEHQTRANADAKWHTDGYGAPSGSGRISFKLGYDVNDPTTTRHLQIDRIVLK